MDSKIIGFIAGSFTSLLWISLPSILSTVFLLALASLSVRKYQLLSCFIFGIVWMASVGHWHNSLQLPSYQTSQPVQIIGSVDSLVIADRNIRFNVKVTHIDDGSLFYPKIFRLSWRAPIWQVQQGQRVKLLVKVKPPHGLANEAGFNYQQWLFSEGIVATGYVKPHRDNLLLNEDATVRQSLLNRMLAYELPNSAWLAALTFGYRGLLVPDDWHLVQKTGIAHLIAISGLHLALVATLSYGLIAWLGGVIVSRFGALHRINLHNLAMLLTVFTTLAYSALAGFGLPTLRAWIMLLLFSLYFLTNKQLGARSLILLGLLVFVLLFPLSIFGLSFWLSFSAVSIICFIFWRWPVKKAGFSLAAVLSGMLKVQLCLTAMMLPLVAWQFSYVSSVSPLVNLLAVPVVTMLLVPICLLGVISLVIDSNGSLVLFSWADQIINYGLTFVGFVLRLEGAYYKLPALPALVWLLVFLWVVGLCLPAFWLNRKYLILLILPIASYWYTPKSHTWRVDVLDVGQGVAVFISKNNRVVIYDVGASYASGFNMADSVLLPVLQARGLSKVDMLFISHSDNDHAGSLPQLLDGIEVAEVLTNVDSCRQHLDFQWQGLRFQALWPDDASKYNDNNGSCVIKVSDGVHSVLLPGDIDKSIEKHLVNIASDQLQATILLAAHHGSNTSSSTEFIQAIDSDYVVFSQGFMNRWQFPRQEVLDRFAQANNNSGKTPQIFTTSHSGQVTFLIHQGSVEAVQVSTHRQDTYPYWYAN